MQVPHPLRVEEGPQRWRDRLPAGRVTGCDAQLVHLQRHDQDVRAAQRQHEWCHLNDGHATAPCGVALACSLHTSWHEAMGAEERLAQAQASCMTVQAQLIIDCWLRRYAVCREPLKATAMLREAERRGFQVFAALWMSVWMSSADFRPLGRGCMAMSDSPWC